MKRRIILTIAKKEFFSFINSPLAYTIIVPFLLISTFLYLRSALVASDASLRAYFDILPWFLLLLAPALSMKLLTDEYKSGTLELLYAHPISERQIVLGKFFGALTFFAVILATTIGLPITLLIYSKPDIGQILGQYLGGLFVGATFLSIGIAASSYVKNAVSSFLLAAATSFVLILIGLDFVTLMLIFPFSRIATELSVVNHAQNLARGLIDIRDIAFFVTIIGVFLTIAISKLSERKFAEDQKSRFKLRQALIFLVGIGILINVLLETYPLRIDMTQNRLFTLSEGTKQTLKNIPDVVSVSVYATHNLPSQLQIQLKSVTDLLKDYEKLNKKLVVQIKYVDIDTTAQSEANNYGIQQVSFNSVGAGKFEVQSGTLGIGIRYGEKTDAIPFVSQTNDLEYQLTRRIRKLTSSKEQALGILNLSQSQTQPLEALLNTQYTIKYVDLNDTELDKKISALLVIDTGTNESTASGTIKNYLSKNGHVIYLGGGVSVDTRSLSATPASASVGAFLSDFGITINKDLVYDLQLNELLAFGQGASQYLTPYPYWIKALPKDIKFAPLSGIASVSLAWPSSILVSEQPGITYHTLLTTSSNAGASVSNFNISPQNVASLTTSNQIYTLAVSAEKGEAKLIVVATPSVAEAQLLQNNQDNIAFISNLIDYAAADKDLATIPAKVGGRAVFTFGSQTELISVQYGNILAPPLIVTLFALWYLRRRRKLTQRIYKVKAKS